MKWQGLKTLPFHYRIPYSRRLCPVLNRKILDIALLRLRFCSIVPAKSDINPGAITRNVIFEQTLSLSGVRR